MDNLVTLQIIVKNSKKTKNKNNKNLFKFLNLNIEEILQSNYYIQLILLNKNNYKFFENKFNNTPALINTSNNNVEVGAYNIINYLITLCEGEGYHEEDPIEQNNFTNKEKKGSGDLLHDFLLNEALKDDTLEDPLDLSKVKDKENQYKKKFEKQKEINHQLSKNMIKNSRYDDRDNNIYNDNNKNRSIDNLTSEEKQNFDNYEVTKTRPISDYMSDDKDLQNFWENMAETE